MIERVMNINAVQAFLLSVMHTNTVRVREADSGIFIEPIREPTTVKQYRCPFLGTVKSDALTVDSFLEMKHAEKEY